MALILDPILAAAQNGQSHKPIVEIVASSPTPDIPLAGQRVSASTTSESKPNSIAHSSGAIYTVYTYGTSIRLTLSDASRQTLSSVDYSMVSGETSVEATVCELANQDIGILILVLTGSNYLLKKLVLSPAGAIVSALADIGTWAIASYTIRAPFVVRLANGTFFLVFSKFTVSGATYAFRKMTSADFVTWAAEAACSVGGLTASKRLDHPCLDQISTGQIWLWFDYLESTSGSGELINAYYSTSSDNGATWANAVKFTNYATYASVGLHPYAVQKLVNQIHLIYTEKSGALHLDQTFAGWCGGTLAFRVVHVHFDSVARKAYVVIGKGDAGVNCIIRIDVDLWVIDACWNTHDAAVPTIPHFSSVWINGNITVRPNRVRSDGHFVGLIGGMLGTGPGHPMAALLDAESDTITEYYFDDFPAQGIARNVNWTSGAVHCSHGWIDADAKRFYLLLHSYKWYNTPPNIRHLGYFDLTEVVAPGGFYTFTDVFRTTGSGLLPDYYEWAGLRPIDWIGTGFPPPHFNGQLGIYPSEDLVIISTGWTLGMGPYAYLTGCTKFFNLTSGAFIKEYKYATHPEYPIHGLHDFDYKDGVVWGNFIYDGTNDPTKRGLCRIDTATDEITTIRPTYTNRDEYGLGPITITDDGTKIITIAMNQNLSPVPTSTYGIAIYTIADGSWVLMDESNVPGLDMGGAFRWITVAYDNATGMIFSGNLTGGYFTAVNINGFIRQPKYQIGTYAGGAWSWSAAASFITGFSEDNAVVVKSPLATEGLFAFWDRSTLGVPSLYWGREGNSLNLSPYHARAKETAIEWTIDGTPNKLSFAVSSGHLFDSQNRSSLLSTYLVKGKKLTIREGETVGGVNYWQDQGSFYITKRKLTYQRGIYPLMELEAEDRRTFWEHKNIMATEYYTAFAEVIMADILESSLGFVTGDVDLPIFDTRRLITHQWVETAAKDIMNALCNRFGYFPRMTVDNKFSARKISNLNAVDHIYPDTTKIENYTPDDSESNFVNQVVVTGHDPTEINVTFREESVGQVTGTIGWWGCKQTYTVYYSQDRARVCLYPRLLVLESAQSLGFRLANMISPLLSPPPLVLFPGGSVSESITYEDPNHQYCVITVRAPNLIPMLIFAIASWAGAHTIPDGLISAFAGVTIPVGRILEGIAMMIVLSILSAIGNFQYEIYAHPRGTIRRTIQNTPDHGNDLESQVALGDTEQQKFDEPLISTVQEANEVADQEILVAKMQRNANSFSKVAHLQDEVGDTIQIVHPNTGEAFKLLAIALKRTMKIPEEAGQDGYWRDEIKGWICE